MEMSDNTYKLVPQTLYLAFFHPYENDFDIS